MPTLDQRESIPFETLDPLAIAILNAAQRLSFANNLEYCGYLAKDLYQVLQATPPRPGRKESCVPNAPRGWTLVASYHTHGAVDPRHPQNSFELPSSSDIQSDMSEGVDGYLATPGGRLWFIDGLEGVAYMVGDTGTLLQDPNFRHSNCAPLLSHSLGELLLMERHGIGPCELNAAPSY